MLGRILRAKHAAAFVGSRMEDYLQLVRIEALELRQELIRTAIGLALLMGAGMLCLCFLSVALIVSAWDTELRILIAWLVCLFWALLGGAGLMVARRGLKPPTPFEDLGSEISRDLAVLKELL